VIFAALLALFLILWSVLYAMLPLLRRGGATLTRRLTRLRENSARLGRWSGYARERWKPFRAYLPIALIVVAGAVLTAWAGDAFLDLAELVHSKSPVLQKVDALVHDWAVSSRTPGATRFFAVMTIIGGPAALAVIVVITLIALLIRGRYRWAAYLALTCGGGALLNLELKRYFARARPDVAEMLRLAHGYSFPSGHAMGSTVTFGALSYLAFRVAKTWRWKAAALALAMTFTIAVSLSRVYLGAHWISDVAAGMSAGAIWVASTTVAYETFRRVRLLRTITGER
jgi:undecaprenyl-diphosphatase